MEFIKLLLGLGLLIIFTWILVRNLKRKNLLHSLLRVDTLLGIVAGLYLVLSSIQLMLH